jgi:Fe-S cluster biogenesis protein NfuA
MSSDHIAIKAEVDRDDINVCKFTVDRTVHEGIAIFNSDDEGKSDKLADRLFKIPGIAKIEVSDNIVTVTQQGGQDWRDIGKRVGSGIRAFLNPPPEVPEGDRLPSDEIRRRVQQVFDEQINPGVASHGGFVELLDVQDDNVFIRMGGGCQGCGAADITLKMGIEKMVREHVPQVREIFDATDHASGQNPYYSPSK